MHIELRADHAKLWPSFATDAVQKRNIESAIRYGAQSHERNQSTVRIDMEGLDNGVLESLLRLFNSKGVRATNNQRIVSSALGSRNSPGVTELQDVEHFPEAFDRWFALNSKRGWLFQSRNDRVYAYAVEGCQLHRYSDGYGRRQKEDVWASIKMVCNAKGGMQESLVTLKQSDVRGLTVPQILEREGFMVDNDELLAIYDKQLLRYTKFRTRQAEQFWCRGEGVKETREWGWWFAERTYTLSVRDKPSKCVIDNPPDERVRGSYPARWREHVVAKSGESVTPYVQVPYHPMVCVFHLGYHVNLWVHANDLKPYVYDDELADKLVLPESHRHLIDALMGNLLKVARSSDDDENSDREEDDDEELESERKSNVLEAKALSTTILCLGPPGVGKTLTAETYAEMVHRPLYEVQSGQLGMDAESVEENLTSIMDRALRLNMVLVLNEGDVFIQKRSNNLEQNAVVSVFLRKFEYHTGLTFVTSNRYEDIDDAFISRCLAVIRYKMPQEEERRKLWRVLLKALDVPQEFRTKELVSTLAGEFNNVSGRDIQNLIQLTKRYVTAYPKEGYTVDTFKRCAVFRGLDLETDKAK